MTPPLPSSPAFTLLHETRFFEYGVDACGQPVVRRKPGALTEGEARWRDLATITGMTPKGEEGGLVRFEGPTRVFGHKADIRVRAEAT